MQKKENVPWDLAKKLIFVYITILLLTVMLLNEDQVSLTGFSLIE